jgi:hypothetical protein
MIVLVLSVSPTRIRRSMQRSGPRGPKRSPTPTSITFPNAASNDSAPLSSPSSPSPATQKPLYLCSPFVEAALVKGNFKTIVMLPKYVDIMEWVAVNSMSSPFRHLQRLMADFTVFFVGVNITVFDFFQNLNMFYGVISECCTQQSCPTMSAGPTYVLSTLRPTFRPITYRALCTGRLNYTWINQDRKSVQLPAPTYIDYVMTWVQNLLDDENTFPTKSGRSIIAPSDHRNMGSHLRRPSIRTRLPCFFSIDHQARLSSALTCVCAHIPRTLPSNPSPSFRAPLQLTLRTFPGIWP